MTADALGRFGVAVSVVADHDCAHVNSEIRWRTLSNGSRQAWRQCLCCFQIVGSAVKHADVPVDAPTFDEHAREDHWLQRSRARSAQYQAQREQYHSERRQELLDYCDTIEWRRKREAVLDRDNYQCQARLPCCIGRASQAHHLTYARVFDEPLFDLISVCRPCHERLHATRNDRD